MAEDLFKSFNPISTTEWWDKIRSDIKLDETKSFEEVEQLLQWTSPDGISVKTFYNRDDLSGRTMSMAPDENNRDWQVIQRIAVTDIELANEQALNALMHGVHSIIFDLGGQPLGQADYSRLTNNILTDIAPLSFENYSEIDLSEPIDTSGCVLDDRLIYALQRNRYDADSFWDEWKKTLLINKNTYGQNFAIDGSIFKEAGADHLQELAYTLSVANEYLNHLDEDQLNSLQGVRIKMNVAGSFFFEIAKLRAIQKLWKALIGQHTNRSIPVYLECSSSRINLSILDTNSNMLRNTGACMSAILGGSNGILIQNHNLSEPVHEGRRWATNISHILKHESHFDQADPARGSYYIESLTEEMASRSWELFKSLESRGGLITCWQSGEIKGEIETSLKNEMDRIASRSSNLIGVNDYPNRLDNLNDYNPEHSADVYLPPARLATDFEKIRLRTGKWISGGHKMPAIYLLRAGKPAVANLRVNYVSNFLACAGLSATVSSGDSIADDLDHIRKQDYDLVILCSDDDSWPEFLKELRIAQTNSLWLAGNPSDLDTATRALIDDAVFNGCHVVEKLNTLQESFFK